MEILNLSDITLVAQDWGGLIGLRLVAADVNRFSRVVTANIMLPDGLHPPPPAFNDWLTLSQDIPELPVGKIISGCNVNVLSDDVIAAYDAPFPDESFKAGARQFPVLVPIQTQSLEEGIRYFKNACRAQKIRRIRS